jgi:hypothetical protein
MILERRPFPKAAAIYLPAYANMLDCIASDRDSGSHSRTKNEARFHA